jgi:predicted PurR-regulated permease PerM
MTTTPVSPASRWSAARVIGATLVALLIAAGFYMLFRFNSVVFVLFVAIVLATALRPAVAWLGRWHIPPWLAILLIYFLIAISSVGLVLLVAPLLLTQSLSLINSVPDYYAQALEYIRAQSNPLLRGLADQLPATLPLNTQVTVGDGVELSTLGQAVGYLQSFGWSVFSMVALVLIVYFWILDREQIVRSTLLLVPTERRAGAREVWDALEEKVGAFVRGQLLLCVSIGAVSLMAFLVIGVPNALLLAVLAGLFEAVPYIGPIFTAALAIVLTLAQAPDKIIWVIVACVVIQQIENALLVPRIMGRTVGVNAVVTLLAITAFGSLLGIVGAIMAIPLAVVLQVLFERVLQTAQQAPNIEVAGRDQIAVLRYEAQGLATNLRNRVRDLPDRADQTNFEEELESLVGEIDHILQASATPDNGGVKQIAGTRN